MKKTFFCTAFFICASAACLSIYINQNTPRGADLIRHNIEALSQTKGSITIPCEEMKNSKCRFDMYDADGKWVAAQEWKNWTKA